MYCVNCGVKLKDTEKECPLCGVGVYHPEIAQKEAEPLYPATPAPQTQRSFWGTPIITTAVFLLAALTVLCCDWQINRRITWSGMVAGALVLAYVLFVLPRWFKEPNPVIFVPCSFAAAGLYLLYLNLATGGSWFLSFAFPVTGAIGAIVTAVTVLLHYLQRGKLYIFGGASLALAGVMLLTEFLINITFNEPRFIGWSIYPLMALGLLGGLLIFLAICRPAREVMERKFFI